jgi:hypothetical protein
MGDLIIKETGKTPSISFLANKGELYISGRSIPDYADEFYADIKKWLENYFDNNPQPNTTLTCSMEYLNSGSSKRLLDLFLLLFSKCRNKNLSYQIFWEYSLSDDEMREEGEIYGSLVPNLFIKPKTA